jgi:hypothetical protein
MERKGGESPEEGQQVRRRELTDLARARHDALSLAIERLERSLAAPAVQRTAPWSERVAAGLSVVRESIRAHVEGVEEEAGLFDEIRRFAPRLTRRVAGLESEHRWLVTRSAALAERLAGDADVDYAAVRRQAAGLLADLRAHRAAEADLVYEAFWTDLGAVD